MCRLYDRLAEGVPIRRALAEVQRELLAERPHPFSWAPFAVVGDPDCALGNHYWVDLGSCRIRTS